MKVKTHITLEVWVLIPTIAIHLEDKEVFIGFMCFGVYIGY